MLSFLAAVSAPLRTRSQNESPGTSWVIMAMTIRGVSAVPDPMPPPLLCGLPPVLEHALSSVTAASPRAAAAFVRVLRARGRSLLSGVIGGPCRVGLVAIGVWGSAFGGGR